MQTYDYIVVGAGSAGAVVANRLSADPRNKVLLFEAGRASHPWSPIPIGMARLIANPAANWLYSSEPAASTNGRRLPVPPGKLLGGSRGIYGMGFGRGQGKDFDTWAQLGNRGWSYADVLPFFKRMESYAGGGDDGLRGREGPLRVTNPEPRDPLFATIIEAAAQVGIRHNPDYNGASQAGIAMSQATIAGGRRMSTAHCYLDPVRNRRNLHIETQALTEGLVRDGKRCTGVRYSVAGEVREARSRGCWRTPRSSTSSCRSAVVMRDDLRPRFDEVRKPLFQRLGDPAMQGLARAAQQCAVGGVLDQRVLEQIFGHRRCAALEDQARFDEKEEGVLQFGFWEP